MSSENIAKLISTLRVDIDFSESWDLPEIYERQKPETAIQRCPFKFNDTDSRTDTAVK